MLELVTLVKLGIIPLVRLPPAQRDVVLPQDLQPALPQAAEGTGVALTFVTFLFASSAESVVEFWFREVCKYVI